MYPGSCIPTHFAKSAKWMGHGCDGYGYCVVALAFWAKSFPERIFQPRQVGSNCIPHDLRIDPIVSMPEPIADAANVPPRKSRIEPLGVVAEANRGLADHKHLAL